LESTLCGQHQFGDGKIAHSPQPLQLEYLSIPLQSYARTTMRGKHLPGNRAAFFYFGIRQVAQ
jgi:hypothetical protein